MQEFRVKKADRLDRALRQAGLSPWMGRQAWENALDSGWVKAAGKVVKKPGFQVAQDTLIQVSLPALGLMAEDQGLQPVFRHGKELAVFNKPPGIPTYPLLPWEKGTLANGIAAWLESEGWMGADAFAHLADPPLLEGGLLQRLDTDTSGLVTVAFTKEAKTAYRKVFSGSVGKEYLAIVGGDPGGLKSSELVYFLPTESAKVRASVEPLPEAVQVSFEIQVLAANAQAGLLRISTTHGLRHVIRAGMAALGFPLLGDRVYGSDSKAAYHQLHGESLQIPGFAKISSRPPESFLDCLKLVGLDYRG